MLTPTRTALATVLLAWLVLPTGCALSRRAEAPAEDDAPYFCKPEVPEPAPRPVPLVALPTGKLDITCQPEAPLAPPKQEDGAEEGGVNIEWEPSEQQRFLSRRCRFVAQAVPLVEVALALSEATGYDVIVQPEVMALRVGVSMADASLREFVAALSSSSGQVTLSVHGGTARFGWREAGASSGCGEELVVRILPVPSGVPGRQLASTVCRHLLSRHGGVSLMGRQLYVSDVRGNHERLDALLRALASKEAP